MMIEFLGYALSALTAVIVTGFALLLVVVIVALTIR